MYELFDIQPFIQMYVMAIASILEADVTVIDKNLVRIAGTGEYYNRIGEKLSESSFFKHVLTTGIPDNIKDVKNEPACVSCSRKDKCGVLACTAYPIFFLKEVIGVIELSAFNKTAEEHIIHNQKNLENFLMYMSMLIESKLSSIKISTSLQQQISEVIKAENSFITNNAFIGNTPEINSILNLVKKISFTNSTILITGESGTGKEVLAKLIHANSNRSNNLMISINCAAIPENLIESELFGYEDGAFTGAKKNGHIGKFELANNSTLFLDEIGDMPLTVQSKLLRVLQEQTIERIGGNKSISIDVRIICATNKNLQQLILEDKFRRDLYYRLNVIPIVIPPLRDRKEDIPVLTRYFIDLYNKKFNINIFDIEPLAMKALVNYDWPGNIRELRNTIEYLVNVCEGNILKLSDMPAKIYQNQDIDIGNKTLNEIISDYEGALLNNLLNNKEYSNNKIALAKHLGISKATLYRKLAEHNLI